MVPSITFRAIVVLPETKMRIRSTIAHLQPSFSGAWRCAASACVWLLALAWLPLASPSTSLCCHRFHCDLSLRCLQPRSRCIVVDSCINVILTMTFNTTTTIVTIIIIIKYIIVRKSNINKTINSIVFKDLSG